MSAEIPPLDPRPLLTMSDMGMAHDMSGMGHMQHGAPSAHGNHSSGSADRASMQMDHGAMKHGERKAAESMDHAAMGHGTMGHGAKPSIAPKHATSERQATVDMQAEQVTRGSTILAWVCATTDGAC